MADQFDMFPREARVETIDPAEVRAELIDLLAIARAARDAAPWDARMQRYHRKVFPQMARWIADEEERDQMCFEFLAELNRIELLLAA